MIYCRIFCGKHGPKKQVKFLSGAEKDLVHNFMCGAHEKSFDVQFVV